MGRHFAILDSDPTAGLSSTVYFYSFPANPSPFPTSFGAYPAGGTAS